MKICPHCGAELPDKAISCKECGSDAETGWAENPGSAQFELPDYDEIVENEFGKKKNLSQKISKIVGAAIAIILALAFLLGTFL